MKKKSKITKEETKRLLGEKKKYRNIMKEVEPFLPEKSHILKRQHGEWDVDRSPLINVQSQNTES